MIDPFSLNKDDIVVDYNRRDIIGTNIRLRE